VTILYVRRRSPRVGPTSAFAVFSGPIYLELSRRGHPRPFSARTAGTPRFRLECMGIHESAESHRPFEPPEPIVTRKTVQLGAGRSRPQRCRAERSTNPVLLDEFAILTIAGGFSYGDDISAGKILATQLIHHLSDALTRFVDRGGLVQGIFNGFQVLSQRGVCSRAAGNGRTAAGRRSR